LLKLTNSAPNNHSPIDFSPAFYDELKTDVVTKVEIICNKILDVFEYEKKHMQIETRKCLFELMNSLVESGLRTITIANEGVMVRIRQRQGKETFERKDLFHIPYPKRHFASSQRFSIPGKSCLYLSFYPGSKFFIDDMLALTWFESEMPKEFSYSLFELQEKLTFLHLGKKGSTYLHEYDEAAKASNVALKQDRQDAIKQYLISFPLRAACFIGIDDKAYRKAAHFHNEYLIPQLLMEWVCRTELSGVVYQSASAIPDASKLKSYNIAMPVKNIDPIDGYDIDLKNAFKWTEPEKINIIAKVASLEEEIKSVFDYAQRIESKIRLSQVSEMHPYNHLVAICYSFVSACSALRNDNIITAETLFHQMSGLGHMSLLINKTIDGVQSAEEWIDNYRGHTNATLLSLNDYDEVLLGFAKINIVIQEVRFSLHPKMLNVPMATKPNFKSIYCSWDKTTSL